MKKNLSIVLAVAILMLSLATIAFAGVDEYATTYSYYYKPGTYTVDIVTNPYPQTYTRTYYFNGKNTTRNAILSTITTNGYITGTPQFGAFNQEVEIMVYPDEGYTVNTIEAFTVSGENVQLFYAGDNIYTFTMPSEKVIIDTTFKTKTPVVIPVVEEPKENKEVAPAKKEEEKKSIPVVEREPEVTTTSETVEKESNASGIWVLICAILVVLGIWFYKKKKSDSVGPML